MRQTLMAFVLASMLIAADAVAGPFAGRFIGGSLQLVLRENDAGAEGEVVIEGRSHPVNATISDTAISGQYLYDGQWIAFQGRLDGTVLVLTSEGESYRLTRQAEPAPEPVAKDMPPDAGSSATGGLQNDGWGIRIEPPATWTGVERDGGFAFGSTTLKGLILVFPHEATTMTELREGAVAGLVEEGGTLSLVGNPKPHGNNGVGAQLEGTLDGLAARAYAVGVLNPHGSGAVVLAVVEAASFTLDHIKAAEALATSIQFYPPPVPDAVKSWERDLAGSQLKYMSYYRSTGGVGGGSTSTNITLTLCGDRSFWYRSRGSTSIDVGGAAAYAAGREGVGGTWSVTPGSQPALVLKFADGSSRSFTLAYENKKLYLGGDRYYWSKANCGG
jgi:hypothetical protein